MTIESSKSSTSSIVDWLASIGLREYADRFVANAIDPSVLSELTEQDLRDLDIPLGHRRKILKAIADSAAQSSAVSTYPSAGVEGAQRRQLTVMFCDLVGSTALSAKLDPEDMREVISTYQSCIAETVSHHNGVIARYMGDGALVYFGYPRAHEDDTEQAVHAALALLDAVPRLQPGVDASLQICIGIATGTVVVGDVLTTEAGVREHAVVGDTPNLAARLQSMAQPGSAVVCANTRRLTDGYFEYLELGASMLKGWAEPIHVWQVVRSTGVKNRFEAQHQNKIMPPLGRDEEIEMLLRRWRAAKRGDGRAVLLTGEPGIGKSHIAVALNELLSADPHITLNYYCSSHHQNSTLFPYIGQLERAAGFERADSHTVRIAKLTSALAGQSATAIALLGNLLSLPLDPRHPLPDAGPQKRKEETLAAFSEQLSQLAARQPVLMIFEDVHWIDPTSLELLAHTVERLPGLRVLLLMTARSEFTPPWPGHAHVSTLPLTRLSRHDGAALVERVTGGRTLPEEVLKQILVRTDGVPLFVEELTKAIIESGQLKERGGQYILEHPLPSLAIPATLNASLMARLDRLASVRDIAQIGAVIGREFSYELLNAVAGLPRSKIDEALEQLVQSELIFRRGTVPQAVYTFKHALLRDAAYAGLLKSRRAQIHAALAEVFEQKFTEIVEGQPETVAHHLTEAGLPDRAISYWLQAGKKAAQRSAHIEAIAHLRRGLELVRSMAAGSASDRTELDFLFAMGPCMIATQGPASSDAVATFVRARELCEKLGDAPEFMQVLFWLTTASVMRGELPRARDTIIPLLERAEARSDRPAVINATRGKAMILMFMGQIVEAGRVIESAFEIFNASTEDERLAARAAGQDAGVADLALMSWTLWLLGRPDTAVKRIDDALRRADEIGHPHTQAYACYYASVLYALRGQPEVAWMHAERCFSLSEALGFRQWYGLSRAIKGICATLLSPSSTELDDVKSAIDEYRGAGYQLGITALYVLLCPVLQLRGQHEIAMDFLDRGLSIVDVNCEKIFESELYRLKALALRHMGAADAVEKAEAMLERALHTARAQQAKSLELRIARDLAYIRAKKGDHGEAREALASICDWFKEGDETQDLRQAKEFVRQL
ncbi:MAG TPA: adenylate/guanylate cyclase domain-containing protein [Pseudolabrys sp.]|nr:adenylate/guanylate cyclase domain-containing protein [Pseudolabrys sp.]